MPWLLMILTSITTTIRYLSVSNASSISAMTEIYASVSAMANPYRNRNWYDKLYWNLTWNTIMCRLTASRTLARFFFSVLSIQIWFGHKKSTDFSSRWIASDGDTTYSMSIFLRTCFAIYMALCWNWYRHAVLMLGIGSSKVSAFGAQPSQSHHIARWSYHQGIQYCRYAGL